MFLGNLLIVSYFCFAKVSARFILLKKESWKFFYEVEQDMLWGSVPHPSQAKRTDSWGGCAGSIKPNVSAGGKLL